MKKINLFIMSFELIMVSILLGLLYNMTVYNKELYISTEQRLSMIGAADKLRQSSDDLTHFGRTYVITNDSKYKDQYFKTLDIRNGKTARPLYYESIYWDLNIKKRLKNHPDGKKLALKEIFKKLPFSNDELELLMLSEKNSNDLVNLEVKAFNAMDGKYQDKDGKYTIKKEPNQKLAIQLVHSNAYYIAKDKIMSPIDDFILMLSKRTKQNVDTIQSKINNNYNLFIIFSLLFIIGNIFVFKYLKNEEKKKIQEKNSLIEKLEISERELEILNGSLELKVEQRTNQLQSLNTKVRKSIEFASLIQQAILPQEEILASYTHDHFTIWQPKDIVGGDIYFVTQLESKEEILVMVIDGAGHGVPGAFVTMLVKAIENQIVAELKAKTLMPNPSLILEYFNKSIKKMLRQEKGSKSNAGFDGGILYYNKTTKECKYAGAKTDLYIINDKKLEIITGDKKNVGFVRTKVEQQYTEHSVNLKENTRLYISTDGIFDQEGENKSRYGVDRFEDFLVEINNYSFEKQSTLIMKSFNNFKKNIKQTDDVTVVGLNFK